MIHHHKVARILVFVALAACSRDNAPSRDDKQANPPSPSAPAASAHTDEPEHERLPKRVRLDPTVVADAKIKTAPVAREVLAASIDLPGEIASDPDKTARISALVGGQIESVKFKEGQSVRKGDVLAVIKVPDLGKAKAAYAATTAKALAARSNADRLHALAEKRLAATQEVLAASAEAEALEAEAHAADEQLRALGNGPSDGATGTQLLIRAPVSGVMVSRDAVVGQAITSDQTMATIADLTEVWFLGRVFEKNLADVRLHAPAEVRLNAYPKELFQGTVEYLSKQIDPTARTVVAHIRLTNRGDLLRLGLFGVARVATGEPSNHPPALVVARDAVTEIGNKPVVFVREPDGDFDVHEVVLGQGALGKVEVVSGLWEGEQVVVDGVFTLKSVVLKSTLVEEE
jgi:cobalt-zinc-cadmium efflux system membrane fusion protein